MRFQINIEDFIVKNNLRQVTSSKSYNIKTEKIDPTGLFSEEIFGRLGSRERKKTFAYVNLNCQIVHPEVFPILTSIDPRFSKLLLKKSKYSIVKGNLVEDPENGNYGIYYFSKIFKDIDWNIFEKTKKSKELEFIKSNLKYVFISKLIIIPAGVRDIRQITRKNIVQMEFAELNKLYDLVINKANNLENPVFDDELKSIVIQSIQSDVLNINKLIKEKIKSKEGLIRGGILSKRIDYSARLVISPDPKLKLGYVGIPWQVVIKLFEPFIIHELLKDASILAMIQSLLESDKPTDVNSLKRFFTKLNEDPSFCPIQLKEYLIHIAEEVVKDKVVIYKRDPVENRDSWLCANIRVDSEGFVLKLNPIEYPRNNADNDGDQYAIYALFTEEAINEAREKMHPRYSKSVWNSVTTSSKCAYSITLDGAAAIYYATKE